MPRPMNLCKRLFRTKLEAVEWTNRQVVRHVRSIEYCAKVQDVDKVATKVEIVDTQHADFAPEAGDEPLAKMAHVFRQNGVYRVGIPAGEW